MPGVKLLEEHRNDIQVQPRRIAFVILVCGYREQRSRLTLDLRRNYDLSVCRAIIG